MNIPEKSFSSKRLLSLDVMRGIIMILLMAESAMLYESLEDMEWAGAAGLLVQQFFHHPWNGLTFWDLVQPAFMTMAGSAMYISYYYKKKKGITWQQNFKHIAARCLKLFICGTALHCIYAGRLVWELWNVLTQLSLTTLIAYLIIQRPAFFQIGLSLTLLLLTEIAYRFILMPGYNEPFVAGKNFGAWMDMKLMGKINTDGWVAINFIPTAAHTIWGMLAGKVLVKEGNAVSKMITLIAAAFICLFVGYFLDILNITPVIKRISTSSFVLVSAGWVLIIMTVLYWIMDVLHWSRYAFVFVVVGVNAIFIYLFFETVGHQWVNGAVSVFISGFLAFTGINDKWIAVCASIATISAEWYLCYWLYKKKIIFKL